jgi:DNA-binding CsgD family transcriptional regulator
MRFSSVTARVPVWAPAVFFAVVGLGSKIVGGNHGVPDVALDALTGGSYLAGGLVLRVRRDRSAIARIMLFAAAAWFAEDLDTSRIDVIANLAVLLPNAFDPFLVMLALSFPSGRLRGSLDRWLVGLSVANAYGLSFLIFLTDPGPPSVSPLSVAFLRVPGAAVPIHRAQDVVGLLVAGLVLAVIIRRQRQRRSADRTEATFTRFALFAGLIFAFLALHELVTYGDPLSASATDSFGALDAVGAIAFPVFVALTLIHADTVRVRVAELMPARLPPDRLGATLRATLGDPAFSILACADDGSVPEPGSGASQLGPRQLRTPLLAAGRQIGLMVHGPELAEQPELLRITAAVATDALSTRHRRTDPAARDAVAQLSPRQREILALLADGHANDAIARRLGISVRTVEKHVRNLYEVLGLPPEMRANRRVAATVAWMEAAADADLGPTVTRSA